MSGERSPTVNPEVKRVFRYSQMVFATLVAIGASIGGVYAFLGNYVTKEDLRKNNIDVVGIGESLPHDARFAIIESELKSVRETADADREVILILKGTSEETLELLAGRIAAETETRRTHRAMRAQEARESFRYHINKGETPMDALRLAVRTRPPGRYGRR